MTSRWSLDAVLARIASAALGARTRLKRGLYALKPYDLSLGGRHPAGIVCTPEETRPGDIAVGNELFRGSYSFAGETIQAPNQAPWAAAGGGRTWRREAHGFAWLNHFDACASPAAKRQSQLLVRDWIKRFARFEAEAWDPEVAGQRLISFSAYAPMILDGADLIFRSAFLDSMARQMRHLSRAATEAPAGPPRLKALTGLAVASLALGEKGRIRERALAALESELARSVFPDGGLITRNPSDLLGVLHDAVMLRDLLPLAKEPVPLGLIKAIDRLAPMIRFFRHGDGGLALFHGSAEEGTERIASLLARAKAPGKPLRNAVHSGFQRLKAGRALLLMDCGAPAAASVHPLAHASALAFEMSFGRDRMIVNCGAPESPEGRLAGACRTTAAHSTLVLNDTNSAEISDTGRWTRPMGGVAALRAESPEGTSIAAFHEGYRRLFGATHRRTLRLDETGSLLSGEDALERDPQRGERLSFDIRFHLHPDVAASPLADGRGVLIRLPHGAGWRFGADGGSVHVEESLYLGRRSEVRRSEQIVVSGALEGERAAVRWSFERLVETPRTPLDEPHDSMPPLDDEGSP